MRQIYFLFLILVVNAVLIPSGLNYINVGIGHLEIVELTIYGLFLFGIYYVLLTKLKPLNRLSYKLTQMQRVSFYLFISLVSISFLFGIMNGNANVFSQSRGLLLLILTFILFMAKSDINENEVAKIFNYITILFFIVSTLVILSYFSSAFGEIYNSISRFDQRYTRFQIAPSGYRGVYSLSITSLSNFLYFYSASNILFGNKRRYDYINTLVGLLATNLYFQKPVVVSFLIGNFIMVSLYMFLRDKVSSFSKVIFYSVIAIIIVVAIGISLPSNTIDQIVDYIEYGWLNIGRGGFEGDLSTGRFELWYQYGLYSLKGFGLSPWGIGKELINAQHANPHNIIIFLAYNTGIISALLYLYFNGSILIRSFQQLKRNTHKINNRAYSSTFGILVFLLTVNIQSLYGGFLDSNYIYIFMYSSMLTWLINYNRILGSTVKS